MPDPADMMQHLRGCFASGKTRTIAWRRAQLDALARMMATEEAAIVDALHRDLGKPRVESLTGEVDIVRKEARLMARNLRHFMRPTEVRSPIVTFPARSKIMPEPLGVALIIGAWNYPMQQVFAPLAGALAAGNCAVLKPSELAPASSALIARLVPQYLDPEAIAVVEGDAHTVQALLKHRFDAIFFTGSSAVGRLVMSAAAPHLTPVTLELGGKCPAIVADDADIAVTARRLVWGRFMNAGQLCIAPDYVYVHKHAHDRLVAALGATIRAFYGEDPRSSPDYGRIVNQRHFDRVSAYLDQGRIAHGGTTDREALYIAPTILTDPQPGSPVMEEEIFGPVLPLIAWSREDEVYEALARRPSPLAVYAFGKSRAFLTRAHNATRSGTFMSNDVVLFQTNPALPFGGLGESGLGNFHGRHSFAAFSHHRAVMLRGFGLDSALRYPPYDAHKLKILRCLA
jgi:acyl-CoA reductase-like NAD-dependent aldehyde dehydrogenase